LISYEAWQLWLRTQHPALSAGASIDGNLSRQSRNQRGDSIVLRCQSCREPDDTGSLTERYDDRIAGVLSCYDRVVVTGTLPTVCYAAGMTKFLYAIGVRIFDYPQFASTLRDRVRARAASLAAQAGITIEHIAKSYIRKEAVVAEVLKRRGEHPGLVHVISAMEACGAYQLWHDKQTHKTFVRPDSGKCLHYYFYFIDAELGLVYLRVPTWAPFRLQFFCNGHSWLARQLTAEGIGFTAADNVFIRIDDWQRAQDLAERLSPDRLHLVLDRYAAQCCPVLDVFRQSYHWSLMQVEYATDLVFRSAGTLRPLYEHLARESSGSSTPRMRLGPQGDRGAKPAPFYESAEPNIPAASYCGMACPAGTCKTLTIFHDGTHGLSPGTDGSNPLPSSRESANPGPARSWR
jgi:hypothetical protein